MIQRYSSNLLIQLQRHRGIGLAQPNLFAAPCQYKSGYLTQVTKCQAVRGGNFATNLSEPTYNNVSLT